MKGKRNTLAIAAGVGALAYFVILGEAGQRDPLLGIRILNAVAAGALILIYLLRAPADSDRIDKGVVVALLLFVVAGVLAQFPRQAFDAVLAALLYAAAFWVARQLLGMGAGRTTFVRVLMGLSALLTFLTAARWLLPALEWWSLTGWSVIPPLDLNLPANPWGHRHDLTLLLVMLYPSWWLGRVSPLQAAAGTVVGIVTLLIILVDGSRNLWLAVAAASVVLAGPIAIRHWPKDRLRQLAVGLGLVVAVSLVVVSGVAGPILQRVLTGGPIAARLAMWESLIDAWLAKPVFGFGPGSFPWVLQFTDYFDTNSWAPRHPDSVIFQLLPEAGLLGVAALLVVFVTVGPTVFRGRSRAALWALITFAFAGLAAQPTDFGFLVALAIGWAAFAVPREAQAPAPAAGRSYRGRGVVLASLIAFVVAAVAWTATAAADLQYGSARSAIAEGRLEEAVPQLELARRLDPGMALYARQVGTVQLLTGDVSGSTQSLKAAVALNPADDLAWRILALAEAASDDAEAVRVAAARAVARQRSDATNLLVWAKWQGETGRHADAIPILTEIVQAWPEVVAAPGWSDMLPPGVSTRDVIELAIGRWSADRPSLETRSLQPLLLAVMAGRAQSVAALAGETLGSSLGAAYLAVMSCDTNARSLLDQAPDQARRSWVYWSLVVRQARLDGQVDLSAERLLEIMTNTPWLSGEFEPAFNPLDENGVGGFSADIWGYRRSPITWPDYELLPSTEAGAAAWLVEPRESVHSADLEATLPRCR